NETPFGGFKQSGIGRDGGDFGLHAYTELQAIIWPGWGGEQHMRGVVFEGGKAAVRDGLDHRAPGPRDVVVAIKAAGVCHSDLSVVDGTIPWPPPAVLGHEGAGVVAEVGAAVTHVVPGDHVVLATLAACGVCR